ncbi:MAG: biotin/lipoate A/B protein ligase family protein [Candidatus Methylomirabilales bacterium]
MSTVLSSPARGKDRNPWRLILDQPHDGPTNMAIDEVLALGCARGWSPPSLRLYRWTVPTVSLGYNQSIHDEVDLTACRQRGIPLVRRPTGGRALLHYQELTYSLTLSTPPGSRSVLQDYQWISNCLLLALRKLGVEVTVSRGDHTRSQTGGVCFMSPSRHELAVDGRKLVGSAQRRFNHALLQQGSLLMDIDYPAWIALFPQARELEARATALRFVLRISPPWEEVAQAIRVGFEEGAEVQMNLGELTPPEWKAARALVQKRYRTTDWTFRR